MDLNLDNVEASNSSKKITTPNEIQNQVQFCLKCNISINFKQETILDYVTCNWCKCQIHRFCFFGVKDCNDKSMESKLYELYEDFHQKGCNFPFQITCSDCKRKIEDSFKIANHPIKEV